MQDYERERREAFEAGKQALAALRQAKSCLSSARNWGIYDILGGGAVSSLIKHSRMEKAKRYLFEARADLRNFESELQEVAHFEKVNLDTRDLPAFTDVIFDDIFSDALMQSRIRKAQEEVDRAIRRVEDILRTL